MLQGRVAWWLGTCAAGKPKFPASSPVASNVQRYTPCCNRPANA